MPVFWTRTGLLAERVTQAFWPFWTVLLVALAPLVMGWHDILPLEVVWGWAVLSVLGLGIALVSGLRRFRFPTLTEALERVDARLPGRPIAALFDDQAIGTGDPASEAVWAAHIRRMEQRTHDARAVEPDLRVSRRDPFGLRYIALLAFVVALLFGSLFRIGTVADITAGPTGQLATWPVGKAVIWWGTRPAPSGNPRLPPEYRGAARSRSGGALVTIAHLMRSKACRASKTPCRPPRDLPKNHGPAAQAELQK